MKLNVKRVLITFGVSAAFLAVVSVVGFLAKYIPLDFWDTIAVASAVFVAGAVLAVILRKKKFISVVSLVVNAISMGFYLRAWYINRGFDNPLWLILLVTLLASLYMLVYVLPLFIPLLRKYCVWYSIIFVVLSIAGYVCLIVFTKTTWVSTLGYFGILQLGFSFALLYNSEEQSCTLRSLQIASYSVAICALIILIIALGGDGLDGLDGIGDGLFVGSTGEKEKQVKEPFPPLNNPPKE